MTYSESIDTLLTEGGNIEMGAGMCPITVTVMARRTGAEKIEGQTWVTVNNPHKLRGPVETDYAMPADEKKVKAALRRAIRKAE